MTEKEFENHKPEYRNNGKKLRGSTPRSGSASADFVLSEKILESYNHYFIEVKNIKEFIRIIKVKLYEKYGIDIETHLSICKEIDKLAGPKLT